MPSESIPEAEERVLSTLNRDGSRRWLRPWVSRGRFLRARRVAAYALILLFTALPYVRIGGKPAMLFDLPAREFTLFGATFLPTDTLLLALLILSIFIGIFLLTALFGRVWCGWGCPQTVYMEFVYRPIERLFEGRHYRTGGRTPLGAWRRIGKYAAFLLVSMFLAHTFLAYFVGVERLARWVTQSPFEHPTAFLVMAGTTALMMLDFCYMREQVCILMCPYGRFQSVLLDERSLIIGYDVDRGEPRGKLARAAAPTAERGDCIDCGRCVTTCPTGIDIREGLQMECIGCAQCIDACDDVMSRIGKPSGLIRYSSQEAMREGSVRVLRPRVVVYPLLLAVVLALFGLALASKQTADITVLRARNATYMVLDSGDVASTVQLKITNRDSASRVYGVEVAGGVARLTSPDLPLGLERGGSGTVTLRLVTPRGLFESGRADLSLVVSDDAGLAIERSVRVIGPLFGGAGEGAAREEPVS
jgi:cytochrome c oxidase accessory protein FixG